MRMYGRLSAIEDEWHIRGIPSWLDPLFTFQRTWFPDDVQASDTFNPTVAKALAFIGGGLLGYYVWDRTKNRAYTGLAGAAGFVVSPMLLAAYDRYSTPDDAQLPSPDQIDTDEPDGQVSPDSVPANTYTPTQTQATTTYQLMPTRTVTDTSKMVIAQRDPKYDLI